MDTQIVDRTTYSEDTLEKVRDTLRDTGRSEYEANEIIRVLQNVGILFRERL
jgi:hypothetical protein